MHIFKAKHLKVKLGLPKQYFWMSKAILYTVSLSITTASALHFKLLCCQQCQLPGWQWSLGDGTRQGLAGSGEYYCMQKQLKKKTKMPLYLYTWGSKKKCMQDKKRYTRKKPGTLPEPMLHLWSEQNWLYLSQLTQRSWLRILSCLSHVDCQVPTSVDIQR